MQSIANECERINLRQVIPPEDEAILRLDETNFAIWVTDPDRPAFPVVTDEIFLGQKILEM